MARGALIGSEGGLNRRQRRLLDAVLNAIIPPARDGEMPGAAAVGVHEYLREHEREVLPGLREALARLEDAAQAQHGMSFTELGSPRQAALLADIRAGEPGFLHALALATVTCYYQNERVLRAIGVDPRPPFPRGHEVPAGDLSLLEAVRERGRLYRQA